MQLGMKGMGRSSLPPLLRVITSLFGIVAVGYMWVAGGAGAEKRKPFQFNEAQNGALLLQSDLARDLLDQTCDRCRQRSHDGV